MCCESDTAVRLREAGCKLTVQRVAIASAVRHASGHVTAAQILGQLRDSYPALDISTIYRNLATLHDIHLITQSDMGSGELVFEWSAPEPHHHLICDRCGGTQQVTHRSFADLTRALESAFGFHAQVDHLGIHGACRECAATASPEPALSASHNNPLPVARDDVRGNAKKRGAA